MKRFFSMPSVERALAVAVITAFFALLVYFPFDVWLRNQEYRLKQKEEVAEIEAWHAKNRRDVKRQLEYWNYVESLKKKVKECEQ